MTTQQLNCSHPMVFIRWMDHRELCVMCKKELNSPLADKEKDGDSNE